MSTSEGDAVIPVTADELAQVSTSGIWASGPSVAPAAAGVGEALVAVLQGTTDRQALTPDLGQLVTEVQRIATPDFPRITAHDGIKLSAHTVKLNTDEPRPVVIVPSGWTPFGWVLFEYTYLQLAKRGYHVLAYTPRGIGTTVQIPGGAFVDAPWTSGGTVDVGGPLDWADGSTVIDYAQQYFHPSRIAFLGESYGSGISQLVAAHDPADRVETVVALSTWGNLATALLGNDTRHLAAVEALVAFTGGPEERKFDTATRKILQDFRDGADLDAVRAWAEERSPQTYADRTSARGIPTFYSNTWHETLFPVNEVLDTFNSLDVPKHLNLWIGDHAAPEGAGLTIPLSGPNLPVAEAFAWLDHHILQAQNEVPGWSQITSQVMFAPAVREARAGWEEVTTGTEKLYLGATPSGSQDGTLGTDPAAGWKVSFTTGNLTEATAVDGLMTTGQEEWKGNPKVYVTGKFDRRYLATWVSSAGARRVRGVPRVHLTVTGVADRSTLVAYLFDLAPDGTARIITHEPYTLTTDAPGQAATVAWDLQAAAYDIGPDHRVMLVVGAKDQLYSDANPAYSTLQITSTAGSEAHLDLPLG
ncbi:CocE/NonD family hydrolase C-terminal non-catalytic domain-containing protein [Streptomyces achromogenes]|uniref:CocE/NonD family hydrolase C-terminal non-catalytic domain-containing protein n=1 Tax=Streptomyces achromogenes TaxID=67255 RepID=UPI0036998CA3